MAAPISKTLEPHLNRTSVPCQGGDSEQLVIELLARVRRAVRNPRAGSDVN